MRKSVTWFLAPEPKVADWIHPDNLVIETELFEIVEGDYLAGILTEWYSQLQRPLHWTVD